MAATAAVAAAPVVDANLYSRQLAVFGTEAMGRLVALDVLIVGARGLGVEIGEAYMRTLNSLPPRGHRAVELVEHCTVWKHRTIALRDAHASPFGPLPHLRLQPSASSWRVPAASPSSTPSSPLGWTWEPMCVGARSPHFVSRTIVLGSGATSARTPFCGGAGNLMEEMRVVWCRCQGVLRTRASLLTT